MSVGRRMTMTGATLLGSSLLVAMALSAPASAASAPAAAAASAPCATTGAQTSHTVTRRLDHAPVSQAQVRRVQQTLDAAKTQRRAGALPATVTIPVYAHQLKSSNAARPAVTSWQVKKSVMVLNDAYHGGQSSASASTRYRFVIQHSTRYPNSNAYDTTTNTDWYWATPNSNGSASPEETAMKQALRLGGGNALNLYFVNQTRSSGLLGWSTFPKDYAGAPKLDGVAINVNAVPRGAYAKYNLGDTGTHEVGHWLGLYHTFRGGCSAPGDGVTDTPAERTPTTGCPRTKNTCPAGRKDPVHNFMDYSYDACMNQFTAGQAERMDVMWAAYRTTSAS